jgi:RNA polymerase sigma factor (sigma-70 family)
VNIEEQIARQLFDTYSSYVFSTALFLTGSQILADDITQDSFVKIFRSYENYDKHKPIKPWIYKIVLNTARTALKQQSKIKTLPLKSELPSIDTDATDGLLEQEYQEALVTALNRVSDKSREMIVLRFFNELSLADIAETLSIPLGTCKSRLNSAIKQLRKELPEYVAAQYRGGEEVEKS